VRKDVENKLMVNGSGEGMPAGSLNLQGKENTLFSESGVRFLEVVCKTEKGEQ